ncbi:haloacid dehalogenase type II [Rhizobium sp. NPDC090279]|uniref:haloacid dehalogenase type II n=1 Tax=Rhizobium sp. NPDC090279 TaxID=3364499 RepID=UPI00383B93B2
MFDAYGTLFDTQSVETTVEEAFPGWGSVISHIWRMKQLEYSWLSTLMDRYEDFWSITQRSLDYTLRSLELACDRQTLEGVAAAYLDLKHFEDAPVCLDALAPYRRAILSNGSSAMLASLAERSKLVRSLDHIISVDMNGAYKPSPRAYMLVGDVLKLPPERVAFVSSNGFDICGAKSFGFTVIRVARSPSGPSFVQAEKPQMDERRLFALMRGQLETFDYPPDFTVQSLAEIPDLFERKVR